MTTKAKKQAFIAQMATLTKGVKYTGAMSGTFAPGVLAAEILPSLRGGQLFTYLFRRFGYPSWGWDEYKTLVQYCITTPADGVFLTIIPYMGDDYEGAGNDPINTELMFGYLIAKEIEDEYYSFVRQGKYQEWEESSRYKTCVKAFEVAIRDLLRPVYIRDVPINCYGRIYDEKFTLPSTDHYHAAGYPIPTVFFKDIKRWEAFTDALITIGNGSMDVGIDNVIKTAATINFYKGEEKNE